ncbi:MAG: hypothetical protein KGL95_14165, partial [Patescibacteria group bacterium]|nr:hypothetical protein [Patescibacteria group bacterium]
QVDPTNFKKAIAEWKACVEGKPLEVFAPEVAPIETKPEQDTNQSEAKVDAKELEDKIIGLLENGVPLHQYDIGTKVGYARNDTKGRLAVKAVLKKLLDEKRVRKIHYVTAKKGVKPRIFYFVNENRAETPIHEKGVEDCKKECEKIGEKILSEYKFNQGWDLEISCSFLDFKSGFQHDLKDDIRKLRESKKPTIFVCANYEVTKRYQNALSVVDDTEGKYNVCCLDTLADVIKELKK